ncbi:MAG: hypothetical protein FJ404_16665 [Verrucomicrobia bacterium]|nr:hypothetical protein [Verrucomicrobiota bacterium]
MKLHSAMVLAALCGLAAALVGAELPSPAERIPLWPGRPPGESSAQGPERKVEGRPRPFYQLTGITQPVLEVFPRPSTSDIPTAVLVCPGGGLQRLAYEHEGLEVAAKLNQMGLTAFVLKYRVPAPIRTALMDAQRAMGLIRKDAARWKIDPDAIGIMGFSAGGEIAAWLMTRSEPRSYPRQDEADETSSLPDFSALIYPGGLLGSKGALKSELSAGLTPNLNPNFVVHALRDASDNSLQWTLALKQAGAPVELHLFQEGIHGFGVRDAGQPVSGWLSHFERWLRSQGQLDPVGVRKLAQSLIQSRSAGVPAPAFKETLPGGSWDQAYRVQSRVVQERGRHAPIAGYKGAAVTASAQQSLGIDRPLTGVLFKPGWLEIGDSRIRVESIPKAAFVVETELGYVLGTDLAFEILHEQQARDMVSSIVPVIELPRSAPPGMARPGGYDLVAGNIGSDRFITGKPFPIAGFDPNRLSVVLRKDGATLHEANGGDVQGGQWRNLMSILNTLVRQGHTLKAGQIILSGALGKIHPGEPGRYEALYGDQHRIEFEVR